MEKDGLVEFSSKSFSIIVPVYNEAYQLAERVETLLSGLPKSCEVIFVCNGCTDRSEEILRGLLNGRASLTSCPKGKARAIREGEALTSLFPRFYIDSDVWISGHDVVTLAAHVDQQIGLVSPRVQFEFANSRSLARSLTLFWSELPHARNDAFHAVLGVSKSVRSRWGEFPDVIADDSFIEGMVCEDEKKVIREATVRICPPETWWSWVRVRVRWRRGLNELRASGYSTERTAGQLRAVLRIARNPKWTLVAIAYVGSVLVARLLALTSQLYEAQWYTDNSSRKGP